VLMYHAINFSGGICTGEVHILFNKGSIHEEE